jgi:hypothetical protein
MPDEVPSESAERLAWMQALRSETEKRHADWKAALEPEHGCTFEVYIQNPYILPPEEEDAYRTAFKVSRPVSDPSGRCVRLDPLMPDNPDETRLVFGDEEIYVANYRNKRPYKWDYPYRYPVEDHFPVADAVLRAAPRPPSPDRKIRRLELARHLADGCFHCLRRDRLWASDEDGEAVAKRPLLGALPNPVEAPDFGVAMVYATARRALDIWKVYLDWDARFAGAVAKPFPWHFAQHRQRLEIVPLINDGAQGLATSGYGYIQLGCGQTDSQHTLPLQDTRAAPEASAALSWPIPYWLNADVLVHELGHHILYATLGFGAGVASGTAGPDWRGLWEPRENGDAFRAFHEAFSDVVAIIVAMHHRGFVDRILRENEGDIFSVNALTSVAEVSRQKTLRNTMNNLRVGDLEAGGEGGYYELAQVISGALFDVLAGFAMRYLAEYNVLPVDLVAAWEAAFDPARAPRKGAPSPESALVDEVQAIYRSPDGAAVLESAVVRARDALGWLLGGYLARRAGAGFDPCSFTLPGLRRDLMDVASGQDSDPGAALGRATLSGAVKRRVVEQCFAWRGI